MSVQSSHTSAHARILSTGVYSTQFRLCLCVNCPPPFFGNQRNCGDAAERWFSLWKNLLAVQQQPHFPVLIVASILPESWEQLLDYDTTLYRLLLSSRQSLKWRPAGPGLYIRQHTQTVLLLLLCVLLGAVPSLLVPLWYSVKRKRRHERESWWKECCSLCGHCCPNPRNNSQSRTDHAHRVFSCIGFFSLFSLPASFYWRWWQRRSSSRRPWWMRHGTVFRPIFISHANKNK